jgi:hypothetical protein
MVPQRLILDFVAPPAPAGFSRVLLVIGVLALVAAGLQFGLVWQDYRAQKALYTAARERAALPLDTPKRSAPAAAGLQTAGTVARDLMAPWAELLRSIEAIQNKDVALQIVEPVAARQSLRITADARNFEAMFDYLQQLRGRALRDVVLVSHQVQQQQPGTPIRFLVQAKWGPGAANAPLPPAPRSGVEANQGDAPHLARGPQ